VPEVAVRRGEFLVVEHLSAGYGASQVLFDVSFTMPATGTVAVVGRNGAGKTTLLRTLMGYHSATSGTVRFAGSDVSSKSPSSRVRSGMGYVPQDGPVFPNLTVRENLIMGASIAPRGERKDIQKALDLFPKLADRLDQKAGTMSGGERKMVGIARALLGQPTLLIMDEPTEGVWHGVVDEIRLRLDEYSRDHAVLLVEQNLEFALAVAQWVILLELGEVVMQGSPEDLDKGGSLRRHLTI
jgi:branched-chain amino acid transport system ATP-binding protein